MRCGEQTKLTRPTLRVIADQLGVSTATVSLAMRDNKRISEGMRSRVKAALVEAGYVYSRSAASLRTSKTHTVGVVLNNISDPFFSALLSTLESELVKAGRTVFLCNSNESVDRQANFIQRMSEYNADGVIVSPAIGSTVDDFTSGRFAVPPLVFISRTFLGSNFDYVINDDQEAARLATNRLLGLGHRRIALVGGDPSVDVFCLRLTGHRAALEKASVVFDDSLVRPCVPTLSSGFEAAAWVAGLSPQPTAAICYNDLVALGLRHGLMRYGLVPGQNFALIGNEDLEESRIIDPPLSATTVSRDEMGRLAAMALINRLDNPDSPPRQIVLESKLIIRGTCGVSVPPGA